jgi:hypothetical protein
VVAAELTTAGADFQQLEPMFAAAERELERAGVRDGPKVVLADAGYCRMATSTRCGSAA